MPGTTTAPKSRSASPEVVAGGLAQRGGAIDVVQDDLPIDDVIDYTRKRMRNRIAQLKAGEYRYTEYLDDDGMGGGVLNECDEVNNSLPMSTLCVPPG